MSELRPSPLRVPDPITGSGAALMDIDEDQLPRRLPRRVLRDFVHNIESEAFNLGREEAGAERDRLEAALRELVECVTALENRAVRSGGEFHVWAEERMVTAARDLARTALRGSEGTPD